MCDLNRLRARDTDCLIYSVGSFDDFSFEEAIMQDVSSACEIHVFDHTVSNPRNKPCGVHFHPWGLGGAHEPAWSDLKSLADIVVALSHKGRTIDVLQIDCEGCEWGTYGSWFDVERRRSGRRAGYHKTVSKYRLRAVRLGAAFFLYQCTS